MGKFSLYTIPLKGLEEGSHNFSYELGNDFFALIGDDAEIKTGRLQVHLVVKKISETFELNFQIQGEVSIPCDRCLDDMTIEVEVVNKLIAKFGENYSEESDEIVIIPESEGEINIAWFLYEFILLSLPMKHVHPSGQCNKVVSSKLNKYRVRSSADEEDDDEDPSDDTHSNQWDVLDQADED